MVKFDQKESLDPNISAFEWFGEVVRIMFNMFVWFCHFLLISEANSCSILM